MQAFFGFFCKWVKGCYPIEGFCQAKMIFCSKKSQIFCLQSIEDIRLSAGLTVIIPNFRVIYKLSMKLSIYLNLVSRIVQLPQHTGYTVSDTFLSYQLLRGSSSICRTYYSLIALF